MQPTYKTATLAGAWCALGMLPYESWESRRGVTSAVSIDIAFPLLAVVFVLVPFYMLVIGHGTTAFERAWFLNKAESARHFQVVKRMLCWFFAAAAGMAITSLLPK